MSRIRLSKAEKQEFDLEGQRYVEQQATALAAFQHLYKGPLEQKGLEALTEDDARTFVHMLHYGNLSNGNAPKKLRIAIRNALTSQSNDIPSRIRGLNQAVAFYGTWIEAGNTNEKYGAINQLEPSFEDYATALEMAGAWEKGQRPSEKTIRGSPEFDVLEGWATKFQGRTDDFVTTDGLCHVRAISGSIENFYDGDKTRTIATRKFCSDFFEVFSGKPPNKTKKYDSSSTIAIERILLDPKGVGDTLGGFAEFVDSYYLLEAEADLAVIDEIPRNERSPSEQVRYVAPILQRQKGGKEKKAVRVKTSKTFLELTKSVDLEERIDLLEVVDRAIIDQGINPLDLYAKLRKTGLKPLEYAEFLMVGDQFGWRPEGSGSTSSFVANRDLEDKDVVATYLMLARTNFNILKVLEEIASNKSGVPAVRELIDNPSLLFVDNSAVDLAILARDYKHGRLIIERYATGKARGLDERADAVLHVGNLRPSLTDLTYIRNRMRKLPEDEVKFILGCDTIPGIMNL